MLQKRHLASSSLIQGAHYFLTSSILPVTTSAVALATEAGFSQVHAGSKYLAFLSPDFQVPCIPSLLALVVPLRLPWGAQILTLCPKH